MTWKVCLLQCRLASKTEHYFLWQQIHCEGVLKKVITPLIDAQSHYLISIAIGVDFQLGLRTTFTYFWPASLSTAAHIVHQIHRNASTGCNPTPIRSILRFDLESQSPQQSRRISVCVFPFVLFVVSL